MRLKIQWNKPVFITENGIADKSDRYRAPFIVAHLQQVKQAITDGADVIGYLHWSLTDNYEWQDAYKPEAKFGLFRTDRGEQPGFNRQITKGAEAFKLIIEKSLAQNKDGIVSYYALSKAKSKLCNNA